jgi:transposase
VRIIRPMAEPLAQTNDERVLQLEEENARLRLLVSTFQEQLRLLRSHRFAPSSEQQQYQARLFDEAEQTAGETPPAPVTPVAAHARAKPGRRPLPAELPRFAELHPLPSQTCTCGHPLTMIEPLRSEQLDVIPAQVFVREHVRERGVCRACDTPPIVAPLPPQPIPKSLASPGLLAFTGVSKYADGIPLYRQSAMHARMNIDLPRHTLASHMVVGGELLTPLVNLLTDRLLESGSINMDETPVQVLKEPKRPAQSKSTMWVMRGGLPGQTVVRFEYDVSRGGAVVERLLADYRGYLQRDGYAAYAKVSAREGVIGLGCFAHVRRKFLDAMKALPASA